METTTSWRLRRRRLGAGPRPGGDPSANGRPGARRTAADPPSGPPSSTTWSPPRLPGPTPTAWSTWPGRSRTRRSGPLTLAATPAGLVRVGFGHEDDVLDELAAEVSPRVVRLPARLDDVRRQLDEYFAGRRRRFDLPLDRRLSHGYRRAVLEALSRVPYGETVSYKDLAERTGNPRPAGPSARPWPRTPSPSSCPATGCCAPAARSAATAAASRPRSGCSATRAPCWADGQVGRPGSVPSRAADASSCSHRSIDRCRSRPLRDSDDDQDQRA